MKKLIIAALLLASFGLAAADEIEGPMDENGVIQLDGGDDDQEPAPNPALQDMDQTFYCVELQKMAEFMAHRRKEGAPESYVVKILAQNNRQDLIWIARRVYWPQNWDKTPSQVGFQIWQACEDKKRNR